MKTKIQWAGWVLAALLFGVLAIQRSCASKSPVPTKIITVTKPADTKYTTIVQHDTALKTMVKTVYKTLPVKIDTEYVLNDYYAFKIYHDSIDTAHVSLKLLDSISQNKLFSRVISVKNNRAVQITKEMPLPKPITKIYEGLFVADKIPFGPSAGISLTLVNKKEQMYQLSYDGITNTVMFGIAWKIHL